jgi:PiT family inorganic phosphate transporter
MWCWSILEMEPNLYFIIFIILIALVFDFLNGFHDSANSIATVVSTQVLKPHWAVLWAAFFNFIAFLFFDVHVATTIGTGLIDPAIIDANVILAALLGATIWNIITWYYGIPSSSSHALIGGLIGSGIIKSSLYSVNFKGLLKILVSIVVSPMLGAILGLLLMALIVRFFFKSTRHKADLVFRKLQLVSSALVSLGHGGNDAQKIMGIIAILLYSAKMIGPEFYVPLWVVISCNFVIALGTLFGGWRIIRTMGMKITKLKPVHGSCAEGAAAIALFIATHFGVPVSTTHTLTGAIVGVGSLQKVSAVRWGVARRIVWAWIITIPATMVLSALIWLLCNWITLML